MQPLPPATENQLTRQERLIIWQRRTGNPNVKLARYAGVEAVTAGRWLRADALPWYRVQLLRDFGVPEELLPAAEGMHGEKVIPASSPSAGA